MPSVDIDGVSLFYMERGTGQPLVFVHGIPTDLRAWNSQVDVFSDRYRVVAYSRRYAHPNKREGDLLDSTIENNAADLVGFIKKLGLAPVHLVGHSYGGFIAAYCASKNPELIRTLILVDPAASTLLIQDPKNPIQFLSLLFRSPSTAVSAAKFRTQSLNPSLAAFHREEFETALRLNLDGIMNRRGAFEQLPEPVRVMLKENERTVGELATKLPAFTKEDVAHISAPTLLINGAQSPKFFHSIVNEMAKVLPNSEVTTIVGSAHFPHIENPAEFNTRLRGFLKEKHELT
jgi:pimeloyl-ACP methyl ester carboxylesterase